MFTRRSKKPFVFWSRVLAGAVVLFPLSLSQVDFRSVIHGGLSVSASRSSPAYAAFEDLRANFNTDFVEIPDRGERIAAGQPVQMQQVVQPRQRLIVMSGMTVRQPPAAVEPAELAPRVIAGTTISRASATAPQSRQQILMAHLNKEDWTAASPAEKARELVEKELQNLQAQGSRKVIHSTTGTEIIVQRPGPQPLIAKNEEPQLPNPEENFVPNFVPMSPDAEASRPLWLNGQIEMTGGLAFVGPETQMVVKRVLNGAIQERGRIWVSEGKFEIHVKRAVGYLVAELQSRDGRILGRGEMNLMHLTEIAAKNNRVEDIRLALRPTTDGATFRAISGYSHGHQKMPVADARVEVQAYSEPQKVSDEGIVTEPSLNHASSFVARATAKKHWSSLVVGQANHAQDIRLFSNSLVEALINLDLDRADRKDAEQESVVWGQLTKDGHPIEGAQIEMAGDYRPIYFNEMYLPDKKMTKTGANGLFAFLRVRAGVQALRVKVKGRLYPAQIFPTENKHVSYIDLEVRDKVVSQFRVFDVLDMERPVSARIRLVGADEFLSLNRNQYVEYSVASDHFMIEADAGADYEVSRMTLTGSPHLVNVPLVKREWFYGLFQQKNISMIPGRGSIVGFIDDQDFEVELTGYGPQEQMQIAYFDADGKFLETKTGVAGGGFVIFNAPMGLQTIYIHPTQSRETYSQVVVAEPQYVHVVAWAAMTKR